MADVANTRITLEQSQAINKNNAAGEAVSFSTTKPQSAVKAGVGVREDNGQVSRVETVQAAQQTAQISKVEPQPNILDQYTSYTYNLSWFLLNPKSFTLNGTQQSKFSGASDQKTQLLRNAQLLMRSGGMPKTTNPNNIDVFNLPNQGYITSPEFDVDFYIDNLEIENKITGHATGNVHNMSDIKFMVYEPYGITLVPKLYRSVQNLYLQAGINEKVNYAAALYGMLISFYGYDEDGNLVKAQNTNKSQLTILNANAVVERFYPFLISDIQFRIANKVTEYSITGKPQPFAINASQDRNTIPAAVNLVGATVKDILTGRGQTGTGSENVAQEGRTSSSTPSQSQTYWADVN